MVTDTVAILPRSQAVAKTIAPLRSWTPFIDVCLLETSEPTNGLFVARSVYPSISADGAFTVRSIRDSELHLGKGTILQTTNPVTIITDVQTNSTTTERDTTATNRRLLVEQIIDNIKSSLPPEMNAKQKQQMAEVLWSSQHCLSTGEMDLEFTDLVEPTINTENARPLRKTLRR